MAIDITFKFWDMIIDRKAEKEFLSREVQEKKILEWNLYLHLGISTVK